LAGRKLGLRSDHRQAMMNNLVKSLFIHERITTTEMRAKEARKLAEKILTMAKQNDLAARRNAFAVLRDETLVKRVFDEIGPRYTERNGGYTRIIKMVPRKGDASSMAVLELVK